MTIKHRENYWWLSPRRLSLYACAAIILGRVLAFQTAPHLRPYGIDSTLHGPLAATGREPAGAETLFSFRTKDLVPSTEKATPKRNDDVGSKSTIVDMLRRIRRRPKQNTTETLPTTGDITSGVKEIQQELTTTLPPWACADDPEEERRLATMKHLLKEDFQALKKASVKMKNGISVKVLDAFPDVYGDLRLLRFLRKDKKQDPKSASHRYRKFLQWRQDHMVDDVRAIVEHHAFRPSPSSLNVVAEYLPCDFDIPHDKHDVGETLPAMLHVSEWDTAGITDMIRRKDLSISEFLHYWTYLYESIHKKLYAETLRRKRMVYLDEAADLSHLHIGQLTPGFISRVLKPWISLTQANYPETAKHIILLNPPVLISFAWRIVTPMASPSTVEKIQFRRFKGDCHDFIKETRMK